MGIQSKLKDTDVENDAFTSFVSFYSLYFVHLSMISSDGEVLAC